MATRDELLLRASQTASGLVGEGQRDVLGANVSPTVAPQPEQSIAPRGRDTITTTMGQPPIADAFRREAITGQEQPGVPRPGEPLPETLGPPQPLQPVTVQPAPRGGAQTVPRLGAGQFNPGFEQGAFSFLGDPENPGVNSAEAIRQYNAAADITRQTTEGIRRDRTQNRLETLALETPVDLDNVGAVRAARALLAQQAGDPDSKELSFRDQIALLGEQRRERKEGRDISKDQRERAQAFQEAQDDRAATEQQARFFPQGVDEDSLAFKQGTEDNKFFDSLKTNIGKNTFNAAFPPASQERGLLMDLAPLERLTRGEGLPIVGSDERLAPASNFKQLLDNFIGVSEGALGDDTVFRFKARGGGEITRSASDFQGEDGFNGARLVQALTKLSRGSATAQNIVSRLYGEKAAAEFFARVRSPADRN